MKYAFQVPLEERVTLFDKRLFGFHTVQGCRRQVETKLRKNIFFLSPTCFDEGYWVFPWNRANMSQRKLFQCATHILES